MNKIGMMLAVGAVGAVVCGCSTVRTDAEGFVAFDGTLTQEAPGEYFVLRFERPDGVYEKGWQKGLTKWLFTEVRQLKDGTTIVEDGVLKKVDRRQAPCNWAKWIRPGSRNVRVKFVDADYTLAGAGVKECPDGFVSLYNGKDLTGWKGMIAEEDWNGKGPGWRRALLPETLWAKQAEADKSMREHWSVRDGVIFFDGLKGGTSVATTRDYRNFEMLVDWRLLRVYGDSGFYLRGMSQVQIWDPNTWAGQGSGGLWNDEKNFFGASSREDRPIGDWNTFRMRMVGDKVTVWFNGIKVVDAIPLENCWNYDWPIPLVDNIQLQCHGDPVEFRNIFIRELPEDPADVPDPAKAVRSGETVDLLKDGLNGWKASDPTKRMGWSVKDGVLSNFITKDPKAASRGGSGGTHLETKRADFFDFDLSYDVLVPAKCNSGVYLRGRYEIQVNDSYGRKPDCHNMAALYDLITPTVAAEKPAGEWQHVDLTLYKRHLTVTLNGVKIIDNQPIAGVTPCAIDWNETVPGPILLQGDHSNASFKNMILTPIVK